MITVTRARRIPDRCEEARAQRAEWENPCELAKDVHGDSDRAKRAAKRGMKSEKNREPEHGGVERGCVSAPGHDITN